MSNTIKLVWNEMLSELFAKVSFDQYMNEFGKLKLKADWEKFSRRVTKAIDLVEIPE